MRIFSYNDRQSMTMLALLLSLILMGGATGIVQATENNEYDHPGMQQEPLLMRFGTNMGAMQPAVSSSALSTSASVAGMPTHEYIVQHSPILSDSMNSEKRSWQSLQGSWGKRNDFINNDYDSNFWSNGDENDYDDGNLNSMNKAQKYADLLQHYSMQPQQQQLLYPNEQKKAWKAMKGAWGKRLGSNGSGDWNKFRGSWGKRETGWNNLKGLWGKRAANWNKLQSAWGKRDLANSDLY